MATAFELELAGPRGAAVWFPPLQRALRGEIKVSELLDASRELDRQFAAPIPGVVIGLTGDGIGYLRDRLAEPGNAAVKAKIEALGHTLGPARESVGPIDLPTWAFWMRRLVEAKLARVVSGQLPEKIEGRPRKRFVAPDQPDPRDNLLRTLTALLAAKLSPAERETFDSTLADLEQAN